MISCMHPEAPFSCDQLQLPIGFRQNGAPGIGSGEAEWLAWSEQSRSYTNSNSTMSPAGLYPPLQRRRAEHGEPNQR